MFNSNGTVTPSIARHILLMSIELLCLVVTILVSASMLMLLGFKDLEYSVLIAGAVTMVFACYGISRFFAVNRIRIWIAHVTMIGLIFIGSAIVASLWLDTTIDSQLYHSEAVLSLAEAWNPYRTNIPVNAIHPEWMGFFAKGPWVNAAVLYHLTGNIEAGKAYSLALLASAFLVAYAMFSTQSNLPARHTPILSLLLAFNPVTIYQLFSFYVDGQLSSCLVILVCLLVMLVRRFEPILMLAVCMVAVLIVNVKLNGGIYMAVLAGGYVLWLLMQRRSEIWWVIGSLILIALVAVVVVGYNPFISQYLRELLATGNPFYPTQWYDLIRIEINTPEGLRPQNRFIRLVLSVLSQTQSDIAPEKLKIPFFIYQEELLNFRNPDARLGGFGPFFSGAMLFTTIIGVGVLAQIRTNVLQTTREISFPVVMVFLVLVSVLVSDQGWWARYAPQLWIIPVLTAALALSTNSVLLRRAGLVIVFTLFINVVLILSVYLVLGVVDQSALRQDLTNLQQQSIKVPIEVNFNRMPMTQWRFDHWNIAYHATDGILFCSEGQQLRNVIFTISVICADN